MTVMTKSHGCLKIGPCVKEKHRCNDHRCLYHTKRANNKGQLRQIKY